MVGGLTVERLFAQMEAIRALDGRLDEYPVDIDRLATLAAETGTFLEINASYNRLDLSDVHARRVRDAGAKLVICSDAHSPGGFQLLRYGVGEARRAAESRRLRERESTNPFPKRLCGSVLGKRIVTSSPGRARSQT